MQPDNISVISTHLVWIEFQPSITVSNDFLWQVKAFICSVSHAHLIGATLRTRNTTTTMRHTALLLGAVAFSTVFCRESEETHCSKNDFQHVHMCLYCEGSAGRISPCSEGPPAVSLGCRSHSWAPRSQTAPPSGELPAKANTLSSFSETGMLTRGFLSCAAVSGTTWTTVGMWEKKQKQGHHLLLKLRQYFILPRLQTGKRSSYFLSHPLDCRPQVLLT